MNLDHTEVLAERIMNVLTSVRWPIAIIPYDAAANNTTGKQHPRWVIVPAAKSTSRQVMA